MRRQAAVLATVLAATVLSGCGTVIDGTPTWPGATLERVVLKEGDFPPGVNYGRIIESPGEPDGGAAGPSALLSNPEGCSNGLTDVISATAERGPGSAAKYSVTYDGARIVMTVLTSKLDLAQLAATADRCATFDAFFDVKSQKIPITTLRLPTDRPDQLAYKQTMLLSGVENSVFMSFENVNGLGVFGIAFPTGQVPPGQPPAPKATLPQTFLDVVDLQVERIEAG